MTLLNFQEFVDLKSIIRDIKASSLGIPRRSMPQITGKHIDDFKKYITKERIRQRVITIDPTKYKASQKEFNDQKVLKLYQDNQAISKNPIIVSKDGYVIDGHHRWIAVFLQNETKNRRQTMQAIEIDLPARKLIDVMKNYDKAAFKKVKEAADQCATTEAQQT